MQIWEAPEDIRELVAELKTANHPHLARASIWSLVSDGPHIIDNQLVATVSGLCTKTEKLRTGHNFKIVVLADGWHLLTETQRRIAIDEALCRCGVQYVPATIQVNKKPEVVKDELGRTVFTDQIATDGQGEPKWKMNRPDASIYFAMIQRHNIYSEPLDNVTRVIAGQPPKKPIAAEQSDVDDPVDDPDDMPVDGPTDDPDDVQNDSGDSL